MQITCTYDSTVYRYDRWVHPTVGSIPTSYGRFTVIMNVNSSTVNLMYYRLQISSPQLSDVGTYYCIFSTIVGGVAFSSSATLVWKDPPQYQTPSRLVYRQFVQQSVLLECNVTNYIQFQWQFPLNYPVPLDSRVQLSGTSLYFSSLSLSNMGTYFCVTTNEITPAYTSFQAILVVYGKKDSVCVLCVCALCVCALCVCCVCALCVCPVCVLCVCPVCVLCVCPVCVLCVCPVCVLCVCVHVCALCVCVCVCVCMCMPML